MTPQVKALRRRVLAMLRETGPRKRSVIDAICGGDRTVLDGLRAEGRVRRIGKKRGSEYGWVPAS